MADQEQGASSLDQAALITFTSDIVAAHVSNNTVGVEAVSELITSTYKALASLGSEVEAEEMPEPAVSVRASVKKDHIVCLDCGQKMKMLKRHLRTEHNLSVEDYRARWGLGADYPVVAPQYAELRRGLAKKIGLGRKPGESQKKKAPSKAGRTAKTAATKKKAPAAKSTAKNADGPSKVATRKTASAKTKTASKKPATSKKPAAKKAAASKAAKK